MQVVLSARKAGDCQKVITASSKHFIRPIVLTNRNSRPHYTVLLQAAATAVPARISTVGLTRLIGLLLSIAARAVITSACIRIVSILRTTLARGLASPSVVSSIPSPKTSRLTKYPPLKWRVFYQNRHRISITNCHQIPIISHQNCTFHCIFTSNSVK